jgi:hypothetical protein
MGPLLNSPCSNSSPIAEVDALIRATAPREANAVEYDWRYRARPEQDEIIGKRLAP